MSETLAEVKMAGRKKESFDRGRVEFKAPPEWIERATREGERLGLNLSAFVRMVVTIYMDKAEAERDEQPRGRKGGGKKGE
jgi:hypothetical protein